MLREYVWLDDMPVAMIDSTGASPAIFYIHTGQIEEPQMMTDASGADVWDAFVEPFGAAQTFATGPDLQVRLPGQFAQSETGVAIAQNWNRDYDASLGRYIEADPLGIEAGQSVYGYVNGKPLEFIDPTGFSFAQSFAAGGAAIGFTATAAASVAIDIPTGGANILATPGELALGTSLGALIGYRIGSLADYLLCRYQFSSPSRPSILFNRRGSRPRRGKPGSSTWVDGQGRRYGPDGFPETDVDTGHDHDGSGDPHGHDWGRPDDGSPPTHRDRGKARPPSPTDPQPPTKS